MSEVETRPPRPLWFWVLLLLAVLIAGWFAWQVLSETDDVRDAAESTVRIRDVVPAVAARDGRAHLERVAQIALSGGGVLSPGRRELASTMTSASVRSG